MDVVKVIRGIILDYKYNCTTQLPLLITVNSLGITVTNT